jgi:hypothetical protein
MTRLKSQLELSDTTRRNTLLHAYPKIISEFLIIKKDSILVKSEF